MTVPVVVRPATSPLLVAPATSADLRWLRPTAAEVRLPEEDPPPVKAPGAEQAQQAQAAGGAEVRYNTPTGQPCPRSVRPDGSVAGDGACHECGLGPACPLRDPWADGILD